MPENVFIDKASSPDEELVITALKSNFTHFLKIREFIHETAGETTEEWKYYGKKICWTLKTLLKKRNLFFISIYDGYFNISFIFEDRAVNAILGSEVSNELKSELKSSRKYAEGTGLTIRVDNHLHLSDIKLLIQYKLNGNPV